MQTEESESKYFLYNTLIRAPRKIVACENNELPLMGCTALQSKALRTFNVEEDLGGRQFAKRLMKKAKTGTVAMLNRSENVGLVIRVPNPLNMLTENLTFSVKSQDLNPKINKNIINPEKIFKSQIDVPERIQCSYLNVS